jgi:hypothetical protein
MFVSMSCVAAVSLKGELGLPLAHIFQGVQILQQTALEKLAAKQKYVTVYTSTHILLCPFL